MIDRSHAEALDAADPLAAFRDRFVIPDPERIYLDGNSLGRLSLDVRGAIDSLIADWGSRAVEGWQDWIELPARVGDRLGVVALGARPGEVLIADSVTVNLYKLAHAAADHRPGPIVTDAANFPTDRYVIEGVARQLGRQYIEADSVHAAIDAARDGILCLSHVDYRSAELRGLHQERHLVCLRARVPGEEQRIEHLVADEREDDEKLHQRIAAKPGWET